MTIQRLSSMLGLLLLGSTLILACDGRSAVGSDDGGAKGGGDASHPQPDGCSYPANGCYGNDGCSGSEYCTASTECLPDPCCPMCAVCFGRCVPRPSECKSNDDCAKGELCKRPEGQCDALGRCEKRPGGCDELYSPVCGCDGKTYSSGDCSAWAAGVSVAKQGPCAPSCDQLQKDYADTLAKARQCCALCDIADQCRETAPASLPCGCPVPINSTNTQLQKQLKDLQKQYSAAGCPIGACPGCAPPPPSIPSCRPDPSGGQGVCGY